ncbi:MAM and LDL-receptor class A domain-containing protein 2, partial [Biomphalaria pfeifferi]
MGGSNAILFTVAVVILITAATAQNLNCTFETDFCAWTQSTADQQNWTRISGKTLTVNTGPNGDHTTSNGYYIYLETSVGNVGSKAQLLSPTITVPASRGCLQFWYSMYGEHVGDLTVYSVVGQSNSRLWTRHGNMGLPWKQAFVDVPAGVYMKLMFEATRGNGYLGDIAIDDISFSSNGICQGAGLGCDFEGSDMCGYVNNPTSVNKWIWGSGSTSSSVRPDRDHSTRTVGGHYVYVDSSMATPTTSLNTHAQLMTKSISGDRQRCLRFFYSMGGAHPGSLNIYTKNATLGTALWALRDFNGAGWMTAEVNLPARSTAYQVVFLVQVYATHSGALSIDDVNILDGACRNSATCNFEQSDLCTWSNDQADQFDWIINRGGTSTSDTGPSNDFTYGNSTGHYIYIESSNRKQGDASRLYSDVIPIFSRPACFNFMYHMKGSDIGTLNFYVKYGLTTMKVWTLSGDQGTSWNSGSFPLPIGARYTRSQILIEGITTAGYKGDIALDDLSLTTIVCQVNPQAANPLAISTTRATTRFTGSTTIPPNLPTVTCNFEGGFCGWTQMTGNNANWTRFRGSTPTGSTGPTGDHTTGNGYYIYLEADNARYNSKARLQSITITPRQNQQCFSFWYSMKGASIGALNIYVKLPSQTMQSLTPLWRRSGAQGNAWLKDSLTIPVGSPYAVVIEAVRGLSVLADIAVDDVSLVDGPCADVTTTRSPGASTVTPAVGAAIHKCDFEDGTAMCGFTQDIHDDFNWGLTSQGTGTFQTGPTNDHTYQTPLGHYAFIDASNQRIGAKAKLVSPTYNDYGKGDLCLHFFYYMYGDGVGTLNVYVQPVSQSILGQPLWRMSGNQGQRWIVGAVPLHTGSLISGYQIIFEGVRGSNFRADIAIDDITVTVGACPNPGACDFENGRCSWTKDRTSMLDWGSLNPDTAKLTPPIDHSTTKELKSEKHLSKFIAILEFYQAKSALSTFLFLFSQTAHTAGDKVGLVSETFPPTSARCMNFWYFMSGNVQSYLNILITTPGSSNVRMVWQLQNQNQGPSWRQARVPIPSIAADYFITIQGVYGADVPNPNGGIGIDDISFLGYSCALFPPNAVPSVGLPINTTPSVRPLQGSPNCDFESGICAWRQDTTDDFDWTSRSGQTPSGGTGPIGDHSKSDGSGKYIYIETSSPQRPGQKARLISPDIGAGSYCVQFYYNMFGQTVGNLNLYVMTGLVLPTPLWSKSGTQGQAWKYQSVDVSPGRVFNIVFEGTVGSSYSGDIALDDILVTNGTCSSVAFASGNIYNSTCTFETDLCGFTQDTTDNFDWDRHKGYTSTITTGPTTDHTLQTPAGYYIYVESSAPRRPGDKARIETKTVPGNAASSQCVSFWYNMYGSTIGTLNVYLKRNGVLGSVAWFRIHDQGSGWKQATYSVPAGSSSFSVVFEGVVGNGIYSDIALDDITIMNSDCSHPGNCNFDTGMCTWKNDQTHDNFDWLITSQSTGSFNTGPVQDHTMNNATGKYVFIDASAPRVQGDKAWFVSQDLSPDMPSCLNFWYNMNGPTVGTLNIWVKQSSDNSLRPIWSLSGNQGQSWMIGQALIPRQTGSYQVMFEGVRGSNWNGDIALDDITFDNTSSCGVFPTGARTSLTAITIPPTPISTTQSTTTRGSLGFTVVNVLDKLKCNFETPCQYQNDVNDKTNWLNNTGSTSSIGTGPPADHTLATVQGHYIYLEASAPAQPGDNAKFVSPAFGAPLGSYCLSFWYHMYGSQMGTLNVQLTDGTSNAVTLWSRHSNQGNQWNLAQVPLTVRSINSKIIFEGIVGSGYLSDIALDDISVSDSTCTLPPACNFDQGNTCSWTQMATGDTFDWTLQKGSTTSIGTGPSNDHTTNSGAGQYIYIETSTPRHQGDTAYLLSSSLAATSGSTSCFKFWYSMKGSSIGQLSLNYVLNGVLPGTPLWQYGKNLNFQDWNLATVPIVSATEFKLLFIGTVGAGYTGDIAIDDITYTRENCPLSPSDARPSGQTTPQAIMTTTINPNSVTSISTSFDCNFESNMCAWMNDQTDNYDWTWGRTASAVATTVSGLPHTDHTTNTGGGHYVYYDMSQGTVGDEGSTAYLISPIVQKSGGKCLRYWYNMNSNVRELGVYVRRGSSLSLPLQQILGSQGPTWKQKALYFNLTGGYQIVFVGKKGIMGTPGIIALDDITLRDGICEAQTASTFALTPSTPFTCDFEQSDLCSFTQGTNDTYDWTWQQRSTDSVSTGPDNDHTYATSAGHYLYAEASGATRKAGDIARMNSPIFTPVTYDICLNFYYHMFGASMGSLNIRLQTGANLLTIKPVMWSMSGNLGNQWNLGQYTMPNAMLKENFQVVFEAVRGTDYFSDIAIDDISVRTGPCPSQATCNFESSLCSFTNLHTDVFDWIRSQGPTSTIGTGPNSDHTLQTSQGWYMYLEASYPRVSGDNAVFSSERLPATTGNGGCFTFWYHMYGSGIGTLNIYLSISPTQNSTIWSLRGNQQNAWLNGQVPVNSPYSSFFIYIEGVRGSDYNGDIAMDDVSYQTTPCGYIPINAKPGNVTALVPGSAATPILGPADCNFDLDFCSWSQSTTDKFDWQRQATRAPTTATGPTKDHAGNGYFTYMDSSYPHLEKDNTVLISPVLTGSKCLTFWYFMWGDHVNKLNVYAGTSMNMLFWFRQGTQGKQWNQANIHFTISSSYKIFIEGVVGSGPKGDIAIDDITVTSGNCSQSNVGMSGPSCDFETDLCHYMYTEANNASPGQSARLIAPQNKITTDTCLEFWYHMYGSGQGTLSVKTTVQSQSKTLWTKSGNQGNVWNRATFDIPGSQYYTDIIFEEIRGRDFSSDTAIDDIVLKYGKCSESNGNCDFELDLCSWTNVLNDDMDWVVGMGNTQSSATGPSSDHTYGNNTGKYLYLETSSPNVAGYVAILSSELFGPRDYVCFHFFYNMYGASIGTLRVRLVSYNASANGLPELSRQVLWELSNNQNQGWKEGVIPIVPQMNSYKIFIEGVVGFSYTGDIGIDDLKFTTDQPSNCRFTPSNAVYTATTAVTVTQPSANIPAGFQCSFDTDLCGWQQDQTDQKDWIRLSGSTPSASTGPSQDHTSGHGFYMYLETSVGHYNDTARLISPQITDNSPQCFTFWYHMYGTSVNSLDVQLWGTDNRFKQAWQRIGTQGNVWKQASINIGGGGTNIAPTAMVVLEAAQGSSFDGDIAIDDINLVPGMCSSSSGSLIDCDFESPDICGYLQDTMDVFDWTRASGGTDSYNTGPTNDHTYKTSAGHYLYTEASGRRLGDAARIWSRAFTPKPGQCLSFFYHMYGADMGNLSISFGQWVNNGQSVKYSPVWSLSGPQPNNWIQQLVPLPNPPATPISLVFEGDIGSSYLSDIAIDDIKLQDFCSSPGDCTFETGLCGWLASQSTFNGIIAQFMRTTANAAVFTNNLPHPVVDHTLSTGNGSYMILVSPANSARQQGQRVNLVSDVIQATGSNGACFHFWFVNYGATYSFLSVATENGPTLWRQNSTTATQTFTEAQLPIISSTPFKIVFNLQLRGGQGYVALDDFSVTDGFCQVKPANAVFGSLPTPPPGQSTVSSISSGPASNVDCNFEKDLCFWHQNTNDQFDWTRLSGRTGSSFTGPSVDHTLKTDSGFYLYIETSSPRRPNDTAVIESPGVTSSGPKCLHFWYHMFGYDINTLNMYTVAPGSVRILVWTRHGAQANDWLDAAVTLQLTAGTTIQFEGVRGTDYQGDIAIDDISLIPGTCVSDTTANRCDFETDMCGYRSETTGLWQRWQSSTSSIATGPTNDHTYGTSQGHYAYAEASSPRMPGDKVRMIGLPRPATTAKCVSYYYHMYGVNMGTLEVRVRTGPNVESSLYTHSGNLGDKWYKNEVTVRSSTSWQLIFESTIGNGYASDIAIDDIVITDGSCGASEGSCDFETNMCTWSSLPRPSSWLWTAGQAIYGYHPSVDHTLATSSGKYLLLSYKSNLISNKAALASQPMPPFNGIKCFTFWYLNSGPGSWLTLYLTDTSNNNLYPIWSQPNSYISEWSYASVPIGPQTSNYIMEFDGQVNSTNGYVAIDDFVGKISTSANCPLYPATAVPVRQPMTSPPSTTPLVPFIPQSKYDCSFESDFCNWTQEHVQDTFDWVRAQGPKGSAATGPVVDHSYGTDAGWYAYITSSYVANPNQAQNQTAWLVSPMIPNTVYCFNLWYHMYGSHVGSLNIYKLNTVTQRKDKYASQSGNHGSAWQFLQIKFTGSGNDEIIIEGVRGTNSLGDIAIDDIIVQVGSTCHAQLGPSCSFDFGDCGWNQSSGDIFNWQKFQGSTTTVGTGPVADHTLGTQFGYYYHIDARPPRVAGDYSYFVSQTITGNNSQCVRFWYSMNGDNVGTLEFGIMAGDTTLGPFRSLWSRSAHQSVNWLLGESTITYPGQSFHIVFKGTVGNGIRGDIAIDDITLSLNECPFRGNNDFENGLDLYTNSVGQIHGDKFDWVVASSALPLFGVSIPFNDHTLRTQQGHFAIAMFTAQAPGNNAYLYTPIHNPDDSWCFTFYYYMTGQDPGMLNVYLYIPDQNTFTLLWSLNDQKDNWNLARIPVSSSSHKFQLVFEANVGTRTDGMIALDDIVSQDSLCTTYPGSARRGDIMTAATRALSTGTTPMPSPYDCTFESASTCTWTQSNTDQFDWSVVQPISQGLVMYATAQDHTQGTNQGFTLHLPTSQIRHPNDTAALSSPSLPPAGALHGDCLSFWYRLYGPSVDGLQVYTVTVNTRTLLWQRLGSQGPDWRLAQVETTGTQYYQYQFVGLRGTTYLGATDVDDIHYSSSPCPFADFSLNSDCDFENGMCGFVQSITDNFDWLLHSSSTTSSGTGPNSDHTYGTMQGHYAYIEASNRAPNLRASLLTPNMTLNYPSNCVKFWYNMYGSTMGSLRVYRLFRGNRQQLWSRSGNQGQQWQMAEVSVLGDNTTTVSLEFEGVVGSSYLSDIALDDVTIRTGPCDSSDSCNFESGFCTWANVRIGDNFDWIIGSGSTPSFNTGPQADNTVGDGTGHYAFIEASAPQRVGDRAYLASQRFSGNQVRCLHFFYNMFGQGIGTLNVYMNTTSLQKVWSLSGPQGRLWSPASVSFNSLVPYQIIIEGTVGSSYEGDIAIDDIFFSNDNCAINPANATVRGSSSSTTAVPSTTTQITSVPTPYDCNFESGFCGWVQDTQDQFDWTRSQGPTGSTQTGPLVDHTKGTAQGWYAYIEASTPRVANDSARLISQVINPGQRCLRFYYVMYGTTVYQLNVYVQQGSQKTRIFRMEGEKGLSWLSASIPINPWTPYQLVIEGVRGSSWSGDIAIDDITVPTGTCPEKTLDAGASSCTFENLPSNNSLCGYTQETDDNFDWSLNSNGTQTQNTGPYTDHTYGSFTGHYIYTEGSSPQKANDTARIRSPTYAPGMSQQHCLTFFYQMYGADIGTLNVYQVSSGKSVHSSVPIWSRSYDMGSGWRKAEMTLDLIGNYQLIFEGIVGSGYRSDIALDDIVVKNGACPNPRTCSFSNDTCLWRNLQDGSDDFDWLRNKGETASFQTGPSSDHTSGGPGGYYMYIESSNRRLGERARLASQMFPAVSNQDYCFSFWYNMYGADIGSLKVLVLNNASYDAISSEATLWELDGQTGPQWMGAQVNISSAYTHKPFMVVLEGVIGKSYGGDIAIDDTSIDPYSCQTVPDYALPTTDALENADCDFDLQTFCSWSGYPNRKLSWMLMSHGTPTVNTGPTSDHTGSGGFYIYLESNNGNQGDDAVLVSPVLPPSIGTACFSFWYHMYGANIGQLQLLTSIGGVTVVQWQRQGNQANRWLQASITLQSTTNYQIFLKAIRGNGFLGDIAVDDLVLVHKPCPHR